MAEHGIEDFLQAKRKAADRLGVNDVAVLPKNIEIEDALRAHQRLFGRDTHDHTLKEQRRIALDTMRILAEFQPRLVGSVLTGTATELQRYQSAFVRRCVRVGGDSAVGNWRAARVLRAARQDGCGTQRQLSGVALRGQWPHRRCHGVSHRRHPAIALFAGRWAAHETRRCARSVGAGRGEFTLPRCPPSPATPPACRASPGPARRCR